MEMMNDIIVFLTSNGDSWIMRYVDPLRKAYDHPYCTLYVPLHDFFLDLP
jgi:hypothetical protein